MLKALLFDLDGTLSDTDPVHFQTWREILQRFEMDLTSEMYKAKISGRLNEDIVRDLLPQLSDEDGAQLIWDKEAKFRSRGTHLLQPMPGLLKILDWAEQSSLELAVVSNAPRENAEFMLRVLNLEERFTTVILGGELERGKPDPLPYQTAIDRLGLQPHAGLAFEDSPSGVRSAVAAKIPTVGIASTQAPERLYEVGAELVIPDFTDPALDSLLSESKAGG